MPGGRPMPPQSVLEETALPVFEPAPELEEWARSQFIEPGADLENPDHEHLQHATIGFLWTNVSNTRKGRQIVGMCEMGEPRGTMGKWPKARAQQQVISWFGFIPDFIITIDAPYCQYACSDAEFCALIEHELYHAAQDVDQYGAPKFRKDSGLPVFTIRGHDIEEFVGVVRRYGAEASGVQSLIEAAKVGPQIAPASIAHACGTCALRAA